MKRNKYGHMVHEYYVQRLRDIMDERRERIANLETREDAEQYVKQVRSAVADSFGPLPERTPLQPAVTGRDQRDGYTVEKVTFESRPGFVVTANLYIPETAAPDGQNPAVLGLCGHAGDGKAEDAYQSFCQGLVNRGFVVLITDPISQGERRQFYPEDGGERPALCHAHNLMGNQQALLDGFFGSWRAWDGIRALDYLLDRPEVDSSRVGVTGNSGGGTLTTHVTALDPRLSMAAPSCYVCSWLANMENELPADAEQNPPDLLHAGLDEVDLLLCHAPRPTIILSQQKDYFDERYARAAYEDLNRVHELLGSPHTAGYFAGPRTHGFYKENREAMYGFFMAHAGVEGEPQERDVNPVEPAELHALAEGTEYRDVSRRVFEFTADRAAELKRKRGNPSAEQVREAAIELLNMPESNGSPHYRCLCHATQGDIEPPARFQFAVETEPGIQAVVTTFGPEQPPMLPPGGNVILYVGHISGIDDVQEVDEVSSLVEGADPVAVVAPRGLGETAAQTCGSHEFLYPYGSDYLYAATGEMLGESYLGRRVFDVMRVTDWLLETRADEVRLVGRGLGSVIAAFAAFLHPVEPEVELLDYLPSYELIATTPVHSWPLSSLLRGCLKRFDLPDLYRALGDRLTTREKWDAQMQRNS